MDFCQEVDEGSLQWVVEAEVSIYIITLLQVISGKSIIYLFILGRGGNRGGSQYKPSDRNVTNEEEKPPDLEKVPPDPDEKTVEELASTQPNPQTNSSVAVADDATVELVKAISGGNAASEVSQNGEKLDDAASNGEPPKNVNSGQVCWRTSPKMNSRHNKHEYKN